MFQICYMLIVFIMKDCLYFVENLNNPFNMSQNKTRFPGQENVVNNPYDRDMFVSNDYNEMKKNDSKGTRIPGMELNENVHRVLNGKPIRGFLFSISRGVVGEFWPLRQGKNTIGSSPECDVCLPEATVSEEHASITIRILEKQGKTIASLKDTDSTNGTKINGEDVDFDANPCKNGDIIQFGSNYDCLLILIDTNEVGLKVAEKFIAIDESENNNPWDESNDSPYKPGHQDPYFNPSQTSKATNAMNGEPMFGGTKHTTEIM